MEKLRKINKTLTWEELRDLDTHRLHYVKVPNTNHIVIDFDIKGKDNKCSAMHLHYIY